MVDNTNLNDDLPLTDKDVPKKDVKPEINQNGGVPEEGAPPSPVYKTDVTPGSGFNPTFKDSSEIMYIAGIHVVREELPEEIEEEQAESEVESVSDGGETVESSDVIQELVETAVDDSAVEEMSEIVAKEEADGAETADEAVEEETPYEESVAPEEIEEAIEEIAEADVGITSDVKDEANEAETVEEAKKVDESEVAAVADEAEKGEKAEYRFEYEPNVLRRPKDQEYSPDRVANPTYISVLQIVSGALLGIAMAIVPIMFYLLSLLDELLICAAVLLLAIGIFANIYAIGRLISARMTGASVHLFHFLFLRFVFDNKKAKLSFAFPSKVMIVATPKKEDETLDTKMIRFFGGGFAITAIFAALLLILAIVFSIVYIGKLVLLILYPAFAAALIVFALNFFPAFRSAAPTDGNIIRALFSRAPRTVYLIRLCIAESQLYMGISPNELDIPDFKLSSVKMTSEPYVEHKENGEDGSAVTVCDEVIVNTALYDDKTDKAVTKKLSREAEQYASEAMDAAYICEETTAKSGDFLPKKEDAEEGEEGAANAEAYTPRAFVDKDLYKAESLRPYPRYLEFAQNPSQYLLLCLFYRYLAELDKQSGEQNKYLLSLQKHIKRFPAQIREYLCRELCYAYSIENNPPAAYDYRRLIRADSSLSFMRIQAYYALRTLGNVHAAEAICVKAKKRFEEMQNDKFVPYMGMAKMEMSLIEALISTFKSPEDDE